MVELPPAIDCNALFDDAVKAGISFVPGHLFSARGLYRNCLRLNCGNPWSARIEKGILQLGALAGNLAPPARQPVKLAESKA